MRKKIYTLGYQGRTLNDLAIIANDKAAIIVDIRYSPTSSNPIYRQDALSRQLGESYTHVGDWGNRNYKGPGGVLLVNFGGGLKKIEALPGDAVILMCACKGYVGCHRQTVASLLMSVGYECEEIPAPENKPPPPFAEQLKLL